jgi:hypothetical protein
MRKLKMGGKKVLRVFVKGKDDLSDLEDLVQEKYQGVFTIELTHEPWACTEDFLATQLHSHRFEGSSDVVVFSAQPEVQSKENLARLIRGVKERLDAHVLICNVSTVDPQDQVHNYHGRPDTWALRAHKFNLALMELSVQEGISVIDVERLVAEHGASRHVLQAGCYSPQVNQAICQELLRVLEDIGFFEERPLVMQVGRGILSCS